MNTGENYLAQGCQWDTGKRNEKINTGRLNQDPAPLVVCLRPVCNAMSTINFTNQAKYHLIGPKRFKIWWLASHQQIPQRHGMKRSAGSREKRQGQPEVLRRRLLGRSHLLRATRRAPPAPAHQAQSEGRPRRRGPLIAREQGRARAPAATGGRRGGGVRTAAWQGAGAAVSGVVGC